LKSLIKELLVRNIKKMKKNERKTTKKLRKCQKRTNFFSLYNLKVKIPSLVVLMGQNTSVSLQAVAKCTNLHKEGVDIMLSSTVRNANFKDGEVSQVLFSFVVTAITSMQLQGHYEFITIASIKYLL
jgi:hypothetical protein